MKKCRLCGREFERGLICSDCKRKIGLFAKGTMVAGIAAGAAVLFKNMDEEKKENLARAGRTIAEEGREVANLCASFIEEHSMMAGEYIDKGLDAIEYRLKGLPAAYAREEHPVLSKKVKGFVNDRILHKDDAEEIYEEED